MSDDPEVIPPNKSSLPATRDERGGVPAPYRDTVPQVTGVVSAALTRFQADRQARAYPSIAEAVQAQTAVLDALTQRHKSQGTLLREVENLRETPETIALDKAERSAQRIARYDELDEAHAERAHQAELARRRRQRELEEADAKTLDAQRAKFNAEQGLQNQQRLKTLNEEIWEKRKETEHLDAERVRTLISQEVDGLKPTQKPGDGTLEDLQELHATLVKNTQALAGHGLTDDAEKYLGLIGELEILIAEKRSE